jgi:hypothetical protein
MPLSEDQVLRYSRQILLPEVGGQGQEKLLASGLQLVGAGPAQAIAAAYLAAAGSSVRCPPGAVTSGEAGFLFAAEDVGRSRADALDAALAEMNPDALAGVGEGCLGEVPASFSGPGPWIAIGRRGDFNEVLYRAPSGCAQCFAESLSALSKPPAADAPFLGAMAALVFQRLCLQLSDALGRLTIDDGGAVLEEPMRCPKCSHGQ